MIFSLLFAALISTGPLPSPIYTPGAVDATKTTEILCAKGYSTKSVRPPASYTDKLKREQMKAWGLPGNAGDYEEDHLISLELGGDPKSPKNLWPEAYLPKPGAREKDKLEDRLHKCVCSGKTKLEDAQQMIRTNWLLYYQQLAKHACPGL